MKKIDWKKAIVIAVIVIVISVSLYFIVRKLSKSIKDNKADREAAQELAQTVTALENAGSAAARLTTTQISNIAAAIHQSVKGLGTDDQKLISNFTAIPTATDYYKVKAQYRSSYSSDMWQDIKDDVNESGSLAESIPIIGSLFTQDSYVYGKLTTHLATIGVPESNR